MRLIPGRVAVTGAGGRLGSALVGALAARGETTALPWRRPEYDLDGSDPGPLLDRDRPSVVVHCAAWTDVDGCAREPEVALRRNGGAVAALASACAARGVGLVLVSTNEVFDGARRDGPGYTETDVPRPCNVYGTSKLAGEEAARSAFDRGPGLWVVRTAWLYGPPGNDFPAKVIAAADRLPADEPLPVVADESGSPTYSRDLARALLDLVEAADGGIFHLANGGGVSRHGWAEAILRRCRPGRALRPISQRDFVRASQPPAWAVLDSAHAAAVAGVRMRGWQEALADYLDSLC